LAFSSLLLLFPFYYFIDFLVEVLNSKSTKYKKKRTYKGKRKTNAWVVSQEALI